MKTTKIILCVALAGIVIISCKKKETTPTPVAQDTLSKDILADLASTVIYPTYMDMATQGDNLYNSIVTFSNAPTAANLTACQQAWRSIRTTWESSEGFLFGPVEINNIDPRIDTWPIDYQKTDSILSSTVALNATYVNTLDEALKGFHPIEYLLFGNGGTKTASAVTSREKEFLIGLSDNLRTLAHQLKDSWDPSKTNNYSVQLSNSGSGSTVFTSQKAAYQQLLGAMSDICNEVATSKLYTPYTQHDPSQEESPFASNSLIDFSNNIKSSQNIYLGKYTNDGKGIEDLIRATNLSMDGIIKTKFSSALTSLSNITMPFGQAITSQPTQIQNAINAISDLKTYLEGPVTDYVNSVIKN